MLSVCITCRFGQIKTPFMVRRVVHYMTGKRDMSVLFYNKNTDLKYCSSIIL